MVVVVAILVSQFACNWSGLLAVALLFIRALLFVDILCCVGWWILLLVGCCGVLIRCFAV